MSEVLEGEWICWEVGEVRRALLAQPSVHKLRPVTQDGVGLGKQLHVAKR